MNLERRKSNQKLILLSAVALTVSLAACGGGGSGSQSSSTATLSSVTSPTPARYDQVSTFVLSGAQLDQVGAPTATGCSNITVQAQTNSSITLSCVPVSLTPTFSLPNNASVSTTVPTPQVTFVTSMGTIVIALAPVQAPITVQNFLGYVHSGYYNQTIIHRITTLANDGIGVDQGGGYTGVDTTNNTLIAQTAATQPAITLETNVGLHNSAGTIAMARTASPNSATSQFFFNAVDNSSQLDYQSSANPGYAVFGSVITGMSVVTAINGVATQTVGVYGEVPVTNVVVQSANQTQ